MTSKASLIRPGLLIGLKSTVYGGVTYQRVDLEHKADEDKDVARWETTRTIEDPEEHQRAVKARSKALAEVRKMCSATPFGLLCPLDREDMLDEAMTGARKIVDEHNASATFTKVQVYMIKGRIASTDEEAARAIGQEVSSMIAEMNGAIDKLDPKAIRDAADRARQMARMLSDDKMVAVTDAIDAARKAARTIVKRIEKDGEEASIVLMDIQRGALEKARMSFLDFDAAPTSGESAPAVNVQRFADLDTEN